MGGSREGISMYVGPWQSAPHRKLLMLCSASIGLSGAPSPLGSFVFPALLHLVWQTLFFRLFDAFYKSEVN